MLLKLAKSSLLIFEHLMPHLSQLLLTFEGSEKSKHSLCSQEASVFQVGRKEKDIWVVVHMWLTLIECYDLRAVGVQNKFCQVWAIFKE